METGETFRRRSDPGWLPAHITTAGPLLASIFLSPPLVKKAITRLSGDQKGNRASSVPGN